MKITLIGMSGVGKSYWSGRLASALDYHVFDCDALINAKTSAALSSLGVGSDFASISRWKGLPGSPGFHDKEQLQIRNEQQTMDEILGMIPSVYGDYVVDTGGSVIYVDDATLTKLRSYSKIVYIQATDSHVDELFNDEVLYVKPLIWGDNFRQLPGESTRDAMKRCFPDLIRWRAKEYERWADLTLSYEEVHRPGLSVPEFMNLLSFKLGA